MFAVYFNGQSAKLLLNVRKHAASTWHTNEVVAYIWSSLLSLCFAFWQIVCIFSIHSPSKCHLKISTMKVNTRATITKKKKRETLRRLRFRSKFSAEYKTPYNNNFMQSLTIDFLLICYSNNLMRFFFMLPRTHKYDNFKNAVEKGNCFHLTPFFVSKYFQVCVWLYIFSDLRFSFDSSLSGWKGWQLC